MVAMVEQDLMVRVTIPHNAQSAQYARHIQQAWHQAIPPGRGKEEGTGHRMTNLPSGRREVISDDFFFTVHSEANVRLFRDALLASPYIPGLQFHCNA